MIIKTLKTLLACCLISATCAAQNGGQHPFVEISPSDVARIEKLLDSHDPWATNLYAKMKSQALKYLNSAPPNSDARDNVEHTSLWLARAYLSIFRTFGAMYLLDSNSSDSNKRANATVWVAGSASASSSSDIRGANGASSYLANMLRLTAAPGPRDPSYHFWEPSHFLDLAQAVHAMAVAYDWLYPAWTAQQRTDLLAAIDQHGLKVGLQAYDNAVVLTSYEAHDSSKAEAAKTELAAVNQKLNSNPQIGWRGNNTGWWAVSPTNWNIVCNSGLLIGALVAKTAFPDDAAKVERLALESIQGTGFASTRLQGKGPLSEFSADGSYAEGPGYSVFASGYAISLISTLFHAEGNDHGLLEANIGLLKLGTYWAYNIGPTGWLFAVSDVGTGPAQPPASIQWLGNQLISGVFQNGKAGGKVIDSSYKTDAEALLYHQSSVNYDDPLRLLYYSPLPESKLSLPLDIAYSDLPSTIFLSAWNDANATYLAAYGGDNEAPHSHLEMGTFTLDAGGTRLVYSLGFDNYGLPGNGDEANQRWKYMRNGTEGQNTLLLSNIDQFPSGYTFESDFSNQDRKGKGKLTVFKSLPNDASSAFDLSSGYPSHGSADIVSRRFSLGGPGRTVASIEDLITPASSTNYKFQAYISSAAKVVIAPDGQSASLTINTNAGGGPLGRMVQMTVRVFSSSRATIRIESALPSDYATEPPPGTRLRQANNSQFQRLAVYVNGLPAAHQSQILVQFLPTGEVASVPAPSF